MGQLGPALLQVQDQVHVSFCTFLSGTQDQWAAATWVCHSHGKLQEYCRARRDMLFYKPHSGIGTSPLFRFFLPKQMTWLYVGGPGTYALPQGAGSEYLLKEHSRNVLFFFIFYRL